MGVSVAVDFSHSRLLYRVACKYNSQALEADALHFSTDIWSSLVVIAGLVMVRLSERLAIPWLMKADAIAALIVAGIVVYVSLQLGRRAVGALLDEVHETLPSELAQVLSFPGVAELRSLRVRHSGTDHFVDLTLAVNRTLSSEGAHEISLKAEHAVQDILPGASVLVYIDPVERKMRSWPIRSMCWRRSMGSGCTTCVCAR